MEDSSMKNKGFTLIELMIVVAIIAIIAAIAIPNLLRSRLQSNEAAAIGNLKTLVASQTAYNAANGLYTGDWGELTTAADGGPAFLDVDLSVPTQGYEYALAEADDGNNFTCLATPETENTGIRIFFVDASGVIRLDDVDGEPI
jgi:type IV pilus assembly protein PilA